MPHIEFKYSTLKGYNLPIIPIDIKGNDWETLWVFVDSGATYSMIDFKESKRLEIDPKKGKKTYVKVADGSYIVAYLLKLPVRIGDIEVKATIGFSEGLGIGFNIMGRKDFFENFKVCFSDKKGLIQFF